MSRALWQGRVWTTAAALALGLAAGTWIVMDDRLTWRVIDDVVLADMMLDRIAALEYAEDPIDVTGWTTLHYAEDPTPDTWGGYEWVQVSNVPDAAGAVFNRTYYFSRRERVARQQYLPVVQLIPDRGFADIYTNSIYLLTDLGPSGGSASGSLFGRPGTVPVGGWVLHGGYLLAPLFLAPHAHVSSGHFLAPAPMYAGGRYLFTSMNLVTSAERYDPNAITVVPGPVDPARASQWRQRHVYFTTNEIMHLPASHDEWIGPSFSGGYGPLDGSDPRVILAPQPAIVRLADQFVEPRSTRAPRTWCDADRAVTGLSDFNGWTNSTPPSIYSHTGHLARVSAWTSWRNRTVRSNALGPYRALGRAALERRTLWVDSYFTNVVQRTFFSRFASGPGFTTSQLLADIANNPDWQFSSETNYPSASWVGMSWGIFRSPYSRDGTNYLQLVYETIEGTPVALLGASHGMDGWSEATAHLSLAWYDPPAFAVPAGSSLVEQPRTLQRIERAIEPDWPVHEFAAFVPAAPPSHDDILRIPYEEGISYIDKRAGYSAALVITACPVFESPIE